MTFGIKRHVIVGANHRSSAASTRDRLFVGEDGHCDFLGRLRDAGLSQALLLSTCARVEVQAVDDDPVAAAGAVARLFAEKSGIGGSDLAPQIYTKRDEEAVHHVFSVTASLDSPVPGEPQVTGQVKDSHQRSLEAGMTGPELEAVLQAAYGVAKRVRNETTIGERPVSIAASALQLARDVHGDPSRCAALLIAGGDMGELIVEQMLGAGLGRLVVTAGVPARAAAIARHFGCHHAPIGTLPDLLVDADIVVASLGSGEYAVAADVVERALAARRRKPVFFIDAAIPGDVQPAVNGLDGAFLYDLDDLERVAARGRAGRDAAAAAARDIIDAEVAAYFRGRAARRAVPAVAAMRDHFESIRAAVLAETGGDDAGEMTRLLINRLLHDPSRVLGEMAADGENPEAAERLLRRLFGLDDAPEHKPEHKRENER